MDGNKEQEEVVQVLFDKLISNCYNNDPNEHHSITHFDLETCFKFDFNHEIEVTECYSLTSEFEYNCMAISDAVNERLKKHYEKHKYYIGDKEN